MPRVERSPLRRLVQFPVFAVILSPLLAACATGAPPAPTGGEISSEAAVPSAAATIAATSLMSLSPDELLRRLGPPDFRRREQPAEFWQYRGAGCVLDVFFYPDHGVMRIVHVATRDPLDLQARLGNCMPEPRLQHAVAN